MNCFRGDVNQPYLISILSETLVALSMLANGSWCTWAHTLTIPAHAASEGAGGEHQSHDNTPLVIGHNRSSTRFVRSRRQPSTAARAAGSHSWSERKCVFACVFDGAPAGRGPLVSRFSALIGVNERLFCSSTSMPLYVCIRVHVAEAKWHTHSSRRDIIPALMMKRMHNNADN